MPGWGIPLCPAAFSELCPEAGPTVDVFLLLLLLFAAVAEEELLLLLWLPLLPARPGCM